MRLLLAERSNRTKTALPWKLHKRYFVVKHTSRSTTERVDEFFARNLIFKRKLCSPMSHIKVYIFCLNLKIFQFINIKNISLPGLKYSLLRHPVNKETWQARDCVVRNDCINIELQGATKCSIYYFILQYSPASSQQPAG